MKKRTLALLAVSASTLVVGSGWAVQAASSPKCGTPVVAATPDFAPGETNDVAWTAPAPTGGGFVLNVSASPDLNPDGSFVTVEKSFGSLSSSTSAYTVSGLAEGAHYYNVRAKNKPQGCSASAWSNVVSTVQDQTGPLVEIVTPEDDGLVVGQSFTVSGTVSDALSGPGQVTVSITNTTPGVAELFAPQTATVDGSTGEWSTTFAGPSVGTYVIEASAVDQVGNESAQAATRTVTVAAL